LLAPDAGILSVEFKYNMMAPAAGERFIARGRVIRSGRTLTIAESAVFAVKDSAENEIGRMLATMMSLDGKGAMQGAAA
jgi:acyl-coenzyme A thioesterase PaaI-like protein